MSEKETVAMSETGIHDDYVPEARIADLMWKVMAELQAVPTFASDEDGELDPDGVFLDMARRIAMVGYAQAWAEGYAGGQDSVYTSANEFPAEIKNPYIEVKS